MEPASFHFPGVCFQQLFCEAEQVPHVTEERDMVLPVQEITPALLPLPPAGAELNV